MPVLEFLNISLLMRSKETFLLELSFSSIVKDLFKIEISRSPEGYSTVDSFSSCLFCSHLFFREDIEVLLIK